MNIVQYGCQQVMIVKEMGTMDVRQRTIKDLTVMEKNVVNNANEIEFRCSHTDRLCGKNWGENMRMTKFLFNGWKCRYNDWICVVVLWSKMAESGQLPSHPVLSDNTVLSDVKDDIKATFKTTYNNNPLKLQHGLNVFM